MSPRASRRTEHEPLGASGSHQLNTPVITWCTTIWRTTSLFILSLLRAFHGHSNATLGLKGCSGVDQFALHVFGILPPVPQECAWSHLHLLLQQAESLVENILYFWHRLIAPITSAD